VTQLLPLLDAVPPIRGRRGRPRRRPRELFADRGYDFDKYRRALRGRGIAPRIARCGVAHGSGLGTIRWVVERAFAWLHAFKRLRTRYERRADIHLGLQQRQQLGHVVPVPAGQHDGERDPGVVDDQVVRGAGMAAVDRRRADMVPPLSACTCEASTAQRSRSSRSAARSSASSSSCRAGQTPASVRVHNPRQRDPVGDREPSGEPVPPRPARR
jgi:transposase